MDPVLSTPEYREFCTEQVGRLIGHGESRGVGRISWVSAYEEMFGPLPEIWSTDAADTLDTAALDRYQRTGVVVAEWDCSPTGGDGDGDVALERREAVTR